MEQIFEINSTIFNYLLFTLKNNNLDQDRVSFSELKNLLHNKKNFTPEEFAYETFYVICVAGFKQDYAKKMCQNVINLIEKQNGNITIDDLSTVYGNKLKVKAIFDVWENRRKYCEYFYACKTNEDKLSFLGSLPFVGNITKYHLARNLGMNFVKYDIWIQRLGVGLYGDESLCDKVNNSRLLPEIKKACDIMFNHIHEETGEMVGFIDVVLWRSCQKGLIKINGKKVFLNKEFEKLFLQK